MKTINVLIALLIFSGSGLPAFAQFPAPPPAPLAPLRSSVELDQLLGSIALYPDPLIAQILPAATQPAQVVMAARYAREGKDSNQIEVQPWDASVRALARYPDVLNMLDANLAWTVALGQAFVSQPVDVMNSIQRLRAQALALGNLQTTPQQQVLVEPDLVQIVPANPEVIYVPVYQPNVVYVQRPLLPGVRFISFGAGLAVGAWLNHDCDWFRHEIVIWHRDHPRPRDWWYHPARERFLPPVVHNPVTVINHYTVRENTTVWHPRTRPGLSPAHLADRGWDSGGSRPRIIERPPAAPPVRVTPVFHDSRPVVARPPHYEVPRVVPSVPMHDAPVTTAPRPSGGALLGVQSARETREFSNRGQQSRQIAPAPAPSARSAGPPASSYGERDRRR